MQSFIKVTQGRFMLNISPWKATLELFLALFPCVCNSVAHVFVASMWKCSFHHRLFCGMMYALHIHKFGEGAVLLCFQTVEVTCDLLELSDKTLNFIVPPQQFRMFKILLLECDDVYAKLCDCGFSRSLQKARASLRQAQLINENECNLLACR